MLTEMFDQFTLLTNCSNKTIIGNCLNKNDFNLNDAIIDYYRNYENNLITSNGNGLICGKCTYKNNTNNGKITNCEVCDADLCFDLTLDNNEVIYDDNTEYNNMDLTLDDDDDDDDGYDNNIYDLTLDDDDNIDIDNNSNSNTNSIKSSNSDEKVNEKDQVHQGSWQNQIFKNYFTAILPMLNDVQTTFIEQKTEHERLTLREFFCNSQLIRTLKKDQLADIGIYLDNDDETNFHVNVSSIAFLPKTKKLLIGNKFEGFPQSILDTMRNLRNEIKSKTRKLRVRQSKVSNIGSDNNNDNNNNNNNNNSITATTATSTTNSNSNEENENHDFKRKRLRSNQIENEKTFSKQSIPISLPIRLPKSLINVTNDQLIAAVEQRLVLLVLLLLLLLMFIIYNNINIIRFDKNLFKKEELPKLIKTLARIASITNDILADNDESYKNDDKIIRNNKGEEHKLMFKVDDFMFAIKLLKTWVSTSSYAMAAMKDFEQIYKSQEISQIPISVYSFYNRDGNRTGTGSLIGVLRPPLVDDKNYQCEIDLIFVTTGFRKQGIIIIIIIIHYYYYYYYYYDHHHHHYY